MALAERTEAAASDEVAAGTPAVKRVELTKRFGRTVALAGLSMTVPRGEVFGFLGPNGAGKTTAVKLLLGLLTPTSGEGWLLGKRLGDLGARRRIGYLPELFRYQAWLSAAEVLALHCELAQVCDRVAVVDHGRVIASGTMDDLLSGTTVRVRVTGLTQADKNKLSGFGRLDDEGDSLTFASLDAGRVPELVSSIVAMGGRVYEVAPRHQTLEDRFLQLLEDEEK